MHHSIALEQLVEKHISLSFSRKKGRFLLSIRGIQVEQNVCEFLQTISFLVGKDIEEYLMNTDNHYDTVRIPLTGSGKAVTLDLLDFIQFRELYSQQMFLLKLEDLLMRKNIQLPKHL